MTASRERWDPGQYARYADERARPFHELVARIDCADPSHIVDLGCGPGGLTSSLARQWPAAHIVGVDSSPAMIDQARAFERPLVRFVLGDLQQFEPDDRCDIVVSNATLQWVPDHVSLFDRFVSWLTAEGWFAFQVPGNFRSPSHQLLAELRQTPRWSPLVGDGAERHLAVRDPEDYAAILARLGLHVDAWETTYLHLLTGADPVLEWVKGTGLRPVLEVLDEPDRREFLAQYAAALREAYPPRSDGVTPFPFRRVFVVAQQR